MVNIIQSYLTNNKLRFKEACESIGPTNNEIWHSSIFGSDDVPHSGGFSNSRLEARKIAFAELIERQVCKNLFNGGPEVRTQWGLNIFPTACGFAAGFELDTTLKRSVYEAAERWIMSNWIDFGYSMEIPTQESIASLMTAPSRYFSSKFEDVIYFKKTIFSAFKNSVLAITSWYTVGILNGGAFLGCGTKDSESETLQHALLESYRHVIAFRNNPNRVDVFPDGRVHFFGRNASAALAQIGDFKNANWPSPKILIQNSIPLFEGEMHIARTLFADYKPWNEGPIDRFVY